MVKFSIITVCYNSDKTIESTIKSVISQSFKDYEYLIIDGASTDNTKKIINKYSKYIDQVVSEKDKGLYDAMNKGVKLSKGDYVFFLNSDDVFIEKNVLFDVSKVISGNPDLVYGDVEFFYPLDNTISRISRVASLSELKKGNMPPHQGSFVKRGLLKKYPFNTNFKSSGDFDLFCRIYKGAIKSIKVPLVIARVTIGGVSTSQISYKETRSIVLKNFGYVPFIVLYFKHSLFAGMRFLINKLGLSRFIRKSAV